MTTLTTTPTEALLPYLPLLLLPLLLLALLSALRPSPLPGPHALSFLAPGPMRDIYTDPLSFSTSFLELSRQHGRVFFLRLGLSRVLVTSHPADMLHLVSESCDFPRSPSIRHVFHTAAPNGLFRMLPDDTHHALRRKLRDSFNHSMLRHFHNAMTLAIDELCHDLRVAADAAEPVDIGHIFSSTAFMVILNVAFGTNFTRQERLEFGNDVEGLTKELMLEFMHLPIRKAFAFLGARNNLYKYRERLRAKCISFMQRRRKETPAQKQARSPDMLDAILALDEFSEETLASITVEFAIAGSHSTSQTLAWCVYDVCRSDRVRKCMEAEFAREVGEVPLDQGLTLDEVERLAYVKNVWKETLRMHPISPQLLRYVTKDVVLKGSGTFVEKGTEVFLHTRMAHLDEELWKRAAEFRPERWEGERVAPGSYLPFGIGRTSCAGKFLADYEGTLVVAEVFRRFRLRLACEETEVETVSRFMDSPRVLRDGKEMCMPVFVEMKE